MKKNLKRWLLPVFAAALSMTAAMTAFAAGTVNVKVENVKGGYLKVWYENAEGRRVYLPIGETVKVPEGTDLRVQNGTIYYIDADGNEIRTFLKTAYKNDELIMENDQYSKTIRADKDITLKAAFGGEIQEREEVNYNGYDLKFTAKDSYEYYQKDPGRFSQQTKLVDRKTNTVLSFSKVKNLDIRYQEIQDLNGQYEQTDCFTINANGVISSGTTALKTGRYYVDIEFDYNGEKYGTGSSIYVDEVINFRAPQLAVWKYDLKNESYSSSSLGSAVGMTIGNADKDTLQVLWNQFKTQPQDELALIANHEKYTGIGTYDYRKNAFTSYDMTQTARKRMGTDRYWVNASLIPENFKPAMIQPLSAADIAPEEVKQGWNNRGGKWFYYTTTDPSSLVINDWVLKGDAEVWVGDDGEMAVNCVVEYDGNSYLVDADGYKIKKNTTVDGMEYIIDEDGVIQDVHVVLATPSNASDALAQTDRVLENLDMMDDEEKETAADMLTEALKKINKPESIKAEELEKFEKLYQAVYKDKISIEPGDVIGGIAAAGLTSKDIEDGNGEVKIEYVTEWLGTASNAQESLDIKLFVNGKERKPILAPVTLTVELPEEFIASYSNAKYNFKVAGAADADVDTEKGTITIKITKIGVYDIKATKKSSGSSGGSGVSSSGGGRGKVTATTKNGTKNGQWIQDEKGWWFKYEDGTWPANTWAYLAWNGAGNWYFFNPDGYMATDWLLWENNYYYLYPIADGNRGYMFTGWHEIGGKWYYFYPMEGSPLGAMAHDAFTPDGYQVGSDGAWIQ